MARRIKVKLQDTTPARVFFLDPDATDGATLDRNLFMADGSLATPASVRAWLDRTASGGTTVVVSGGGAGVTSHRLLQGLTLGDDHPQYLRKDVLTSEGDIYIRDDDSPIRLAIGDTADVLTVVAGRPAWVATTSLEEVQAGLGIEIDDYDPLRPSIAIDHTLTFLTQEAEASLPSSRRLAAGSNIALDDTVAGVLTITGTAAAVSGADPTATIGLAVVNGSAGTFLRSDGAPALSQSISPTWSGTHVFSNPLEIGHATDTSLARESAGILGVEGHTLTTDDQAQTISAAWNFTTAPQVTSLEVGNATDTTLARNAAGVLQVEGNIIWSQNNIGAQINALTEDTGPAGGDFVVTYDLSATTQKKVKLSNFTTGIGGSLAALSVEILADTPVAYWKFDEASGNFADSSGNSRTLTAAGTPSYQFVALVPRETTKFVYFDGTGDTATRADQCGLTVPSNADFTCVAVAMSATISSDVRVFELVAAGELEAANFQDYCRFASGKMSMFWENGAGADNNIDSTTAHVPIFQPVHVAFVKDGTANTVSMYINGTLREVVAYATEPTGGSTTTAAIHASGGGLALAHVAVYNTALSTARIRAHAQAAGFLVAQ